MAFTRSTSLASLTIALILTPALSAYAGAAQPPDNSSQNKVQNKTKGKTADNQPDAKGDRLITQQVRKALIADKDLSTYAHNVKIMTVNGAVTLKGPVKSEDEKNKVATDAASAVSADKITNDLTVKQ